MGFIVDSIASIVRLAINVTGSQRAYLKWRTSEEGQKCFSRREERRFYKALAEGKTDVIDVGIREKQLRIDRLKAELGLAVVLVALMLGGCRTYSIPDAIPDAHVASLKENERTYVVSNMDLHVPGEGEKRLAGQWHVVSSDFIRDHVRNQDDLIRLLEMIKKERKAGKWTSVGFAGGGTLLGFIIGVGIISVLNLRKE